MKNPSHRGRTASTDGVADPQCSTNPRRYEQLRRRPFFSASSACWRSRSYFRRHIRGRFLRFPHPGARIERPSASASTAPQCLAVMSACRARAFAPADLARDRRRECTNARCSMRQRRFAPQARIERPPKFASAAPKLLETASAALPSSSRAPIPFATAGANAQWCEAFQDAAAQEPTGRIQKYLARSMIQKSADGSLFRTRTAADSALSESPRILSERTRVFPAAAPASGRDTRSCAV